MSVEPASLARDISAAWADRVLRGEQPDSSLSVSSHAGLPIAGSKNYTAWQVQGSKRERVEDDRIAGTHYVWETVKLESPSQMTNSDDGRFNTAGPLRSIRCLLRLRLLQ